MHSERAPGSSVGLLQLLLLLLVLLQVRELGGRVRLDLRVGRQLGAQLAQLHVVPRRRRRRVAAAQQRVLRRLQARRLRTHVPRHLGSRLLGLDPRTLNPSSCPQARRFKANHAAQI